MSNTDQKLPNYLGPMLKIAASKGPGWTGHLNTYHDGWCAIFKGGICDCNPIVREARPVAN